SHHLQDQGEVVIGSSADCGLRIDDPSVAARHALLHLGPSASIEDLGSPAGTVVGDAKLPAHQAISLTPGEMITLGSVMLIFQKRMNNPPRRFWTHGYSETRSAA